MTGPQYTTCCQKEDYEDYSGIGIVLTGNYWEATDYMLHRKLVCLGHVEPSADAGGGKPRLARSRDPGTSCAIGRIASFEPPSSKSFPDTIDNDFSFNIVLRPNDEGRNDPRDPYPPGLSDNPFLDAGWPALSDTGRKHAVDEGYQGVLIADTHDVPKPHEAAGPSWTPGYATQMFFDPAKNQSGAAMVILSHRYVWFIDGSVENYPVDAPGAYKVPVLHCECEGSRIHDIFNVADQMPGGGSGCKKNWFTSFVCFVLRTIFFPVTTAFVAEAWAKARDGDYHDAIEGNGDLKLGDLVVVKGRWVFDAGHEGSNEIHAVSTIQKVPDSVDQPAEPPPGAGGTAFDAFYRDWCGLSSEVPPDHEPGARPPDMTATQTAIYDAQQRPENGYTIHPDVDGCLPRGAPVVRAVEPAQFAPGDRDQDVVVLGSGFAAGAQVTVRGPDIPVSAVTVRSATEIAATLALTSATPTGRRDVTVTNPDGGTASCAGCLTISGAPIIH